MPPGACYEGLCCLWQQLEEDLEEKTMMEGWVALRLGSRSSVWSRWTRRDGHGCTTTAGLHTCRLLKPTSQKFPFGSLYLSFAAL